MIRNYLPGDGAALLHIWNTAGVRAGFAPLDGADFDQILLCHRDFSPNFTFVLEENGEILGNPMWSAEIPQAGKTGMDLLVALQGNVCAGFTGPVYPEKTGRGYFAGIGVAPQFEKRGFGTLLFYRLLDREKETGAKYMSLFTGEHNHAGQIYIGAGFRVVRRFAVMLKEL